MHLTGHKSLIVLPVTMTFTVTNDQNENSPQMTDRLRSVAVFGALQASITIPVTVLVMQDGFSVL